MDRPARDGITAVLSVRGLSMTFGATRALEGVDIDLLQGEVLGLIGTNGAGKSTLIKIVAGLHEHTEGVMKLNGEETTFASPRVAQQSGIATVYQDLALAPLMSVWRNFFLGNEVRKGLGLDIDEMKRVAGEELTKMGIVIPDLDRPVSALSGGQRQVIAIARAIYFGANVVILDEPTAALGVKQGRRVLELMLDVKKRGLPIILISHNMPHVFEVADRIHIHRLGRRIAVIDPRQYTMSDAVAIMTGAVPPPPVEAWATGAPVALATAQAG